MDWPGKTQQLLDQRIVKLTARGTPIIALLDLISQLWLCLPLFLDKILRAQLRPPSLVPHDVAPVLD